jgi:DNA modification methylase
VREIVAAAPGEHFILWHDLEDERRALEEEFPSRRWGAWGEFKDGNRHALALYERHYSAYQYADGRERDLFMGPGEKMVLMTDALDALFGWRKFKDASGQQGVNCSVFRNEGKLQSSALIREAMAIAWQRWPGERFYTYVMRRRRPAGAARPRRRANASSTPAGATAARRRAASGSSRRRPSSTPGEIIPSRHAAAVYGTQDLDAREAIIGDFAEGRLALLAAKPVMLGSGTNLQRHCHRAIFAGVGLQVQRPDPVDPPAAALPAGAAGRDRHHPCRDRDRGAALAAGEVAAARRAQRADGRDHPHLWPEPRRRGGDAEAGDRLRAGRSGAASPLPMTARPARAPALPLWRAVNNDCVDECRRMADDSVDLVVTSIPFGNHYEYSESYNDFGHTDDHGHFFEQMDFLTPELLRIVKPGRIAAVHVKDRIRFASVTGLTRPTVEPFHCDTIRHFQRHGFAYAGLRFISTDVVRENNQTYRLTYKQLKKDSTTMGAGSPEFLLLFFKLPTDHGNGYADEPVTKDPADYSLARWQIDADALWRSSGDRPLTAADLAGMRPEVLAKMLPAWSVQDVYDHEDHVAIGEALAARNALPKTFSVLRAGSCRDDVDTDVARMLTLNSQQARRRVEQHICPLQFDIVDRAIRLYSNPGELVFDPFMGLGTVPYRAMKLGRRGAGVELNPTSFADAVHYLREAEAERAVP